MKNYFSGIKKINNWFDSLHWIMQYILLLILIVIVRTFIFGVYIVPTGSMEPTILVGESFIASKFSVYYKNVERGEIISFNDPTYQYSDNYFVACFERYFFGPESWTKRVIGVPGDRVEGKIINGKTYIFLNGKELDEPYLNSYPLVKVREEAWRLSTAFPGITPGCVIPFFRKEVSSKYRTFDPSLPLNSEEQPFYNLYLEDKLPSNDAPKILYPRTKSANGSVSDIFDVTLGEDEYWCMGDNRMGSFDSRGFGVVKKWMIHGKILFRIFSLKSSNSLLYDCFIMPVKRVYFYFSSLFREKNRWLSFVS
jgi:signal peptidase I